MPVIYIAGAFHDKQFRTKQATQIAEKRFFKRINRLVKCVTYMLIIISFVYSKLIPCIIMTIEFPSQ